MSDQHLANENELDDIEPGMRVESSDGDLGGHDISAPTVKDVVRDAKGNVEEIVVEKGVLFRKQIDIPADRVETVEHAPEPRAPHGELRIEAGEHELEALPARGEDALPSEAEIAEERAARKDADQTKAPLEELEETLPTAEGLRRLEGREARAHRRHRWLFQRQRPAEARRDDRVFSLRNIGPGFISGMSGNDSTAVTSYAVVGAAAGFGQLWLLLLATPLYQSVQYACGKIGRVTGTGLGGTLRTRYGRRVAVPAALILALANITLLAGDLVAIGSGLQLFSGLDWAWFVIPAGILLWYVTVYENFNRIKQIFVALSLVFVVYIVTAIVSRPHWGDVLAGTFVPHLSFGLVGISTAVGLLGATLSPYSMFWQAQGEIEEKRTGSQRTQLRKMAADIGAGTISGNLVAYFIIVSTAATLFVHHQQITTAADAAKALQPLLGPLAKYLFGLGLIGAGVVAVPVLMASTSYALSGAFGWPASLWRKPWQNEGFYIVMTVAIVASMGLALLRINPIQLIFYANILQGVLAPALVVLILLTGNSRRVMGDHRFRWATNTGLVLSAVVLVVGTVLLAFGLLTGGA